MAATVGTTMRQGIGIIATIVRIVGLVIVAILVAHIVLTLLDANPQNFLTEFVSTWAAQFNLGLANLFTPEQPKMAVTLNYGVAAILWMIVTAVVVRLLRRV
ncbi:hypothetical protein [Pseudonocardia sp. EC080625-04]|uniref:hypothetical protein n=1 Tax=Pseudonocardia sp. EC080625-04 TaxID=1096868 RepID=UPI000AECDB0C|nr:hypothetical protein [Pseudonocardia sp. EC080625-04]